MASLAKKLKINEWGKSEVFALALALIVFCVGGYYVVLHPAKRILVVVFLAIAIPFALGFWYYKQHHDVSMVFKKMFPLVLVLCSIAYAVGITAGRVPDEYFHYKQSYRYANILSFHESGYMRTEDESFILAVHGKNGKDFTPQTVREEQKFYHVFLRDTHTTNTSDFLTGGMNLSGNPPQLKLASAFGILVGRGLGLSAAITFYFGRIFNALFACLLIIFAVRVAPVGKNILMALALMPMSLHLIGSYSYDAGIIGFAFLDIALLLNLWYGKKKISAWRELLPFIVVSMLFAQCKLLYTPISLMVCFIPRERFASHMSVKKVKVVMVLCILAGLAIGIAARGVTLAYVAPQYDLNLSNQSVQTYPMSLLFQNPGKALNLLLNTPLVKEDAYLLSFVGGSLGWFTINIPNTFVVMLCIILGISILYCDDDTFVLSVRNKILFMVVSFAIFNVVQLALMVDFTPNTYTFIEGVQGRYFIPFAPLVMLVLRTKWIQVKGNLAFCSMLSMSVMSLMCLARILFNLYGGVALI